MIVERMVKKGGGLLRCEGSRGPSHLGGEASREGCQEIKRGVQRRRSRLHKSTIQRETHSRHVQPRLKRPTKIGGKGGRSGEAAFAGRVVSWWGRVLYSRGSANVKKEEERSDLEGIKKKRVGHYQGLDGLRVSKGGMSGFRKLGKMAAP